MSEIGTTGETDLDPLGIPMPQSMGQQQDYPYTPGVRDVYIDGKLTKYSGPGVVDANDNFGLLDEAGNPTYYDLRNDPTQLYFALGEEQLSNLIDILDRKNYRVDTGPQVVSALTDLMETANIMGRTWDVALRLIDQKFPDRAEQIAAPRYRVSAKADIRTVANQVAKQTLGREFTEQEAERFVQSYQQAELGYQQARSGVIEQPPAMDVAAQQFAQEVAPTEANAYKYLGAVDMLMKNLGAV